ncbi:MAG: MerR family transcriptional regulator, partial [Clostridia bacterium]|nr:MerR family transcriptional regulator [Clostridia bacterium]
MNELTKIKDVSSRYNITARTLRYYEDAGLITSVRSEDYAHRLYDEAAIMRLKQILILRKLNISIKDIKRIFSAPGSEVVLEVLGKKADDVADEIALLQELKEIVLDFIRQIEQADFHSESAVKRLYDKAKQIETQLTVPEYNGNPSDMNRLLKVTEELDDKMLRLPAAIRAYRQSVGAMRFIGKKYPNGGTAWSDWDSRPDSDMFLKQKIGIDLKNFYEDGDAVVGLMRHKDGSHRNFEYWIGFFTPANTP